MTPRLGDCPQVAHYPLPRLNEVPKPHLDALIMALHPLCMIVPTIFVPIPPVAPALMSLVHPMSSMENEPISRKLKMKDNLMLEEEFLLRNKGPVSIKVQVPNMQ